MLRRSVSGAIFVVLILGAALNQYSFFGLLLIIAILGLKELYQLVKEKSIFPSLKVGLVGGICVYFAAVVGNYGISNKYSFLIILFLPVTLVFELFRDQKHPFANAAVTIFGWVYVVFPLALIICFAFSNPEGKFNYLFPMGYFLLIWINDTGAYVFGKSFGKRKLFERISPNKTWEGTISGVSLASVGGFFLGPFFFDCTPLQGAILGLMVGSFGTLGDLVESMFKRSVGVKDSGTIMPGHGGVLDRFDGVILSSPIAFLYLNFLN